MSVFHVLNASQQVAAHLRQELLRRRWTKIMPGGDRLAAELGVGRSTMETALGQLESEGWLIHQGKRGRRISLPPEQARPALRVAIQLVDDYDRTREYIINLKHELALAGHEPIFSKILPKGKPGDLRPLARTVERTAADAWIIMGGTLEELQWFIARGIPAFALFGRGSSLEIAGGGPVMADACRQGVRALIAAGHRRIVLICRKWRLVPETGKPEQAILDEMQAQGIPVSGYNRPVWEDTTDGLHACLESLFAITPPTALYVDEVSVFTAVYQFLAQRRLRVPQDVSLICSEWDASFSWCRIPVAHFRWDSRPVIRRAVRWATNISHGKPDLQKSLTEAKFVPGATIGPPPRG